MAKPPYGVGREKFFTDQGYTISGTVQVGVNDGTELGWFLEKGQVPILGFEPIPDVYAQTCLDFKNEIDQGLIQLHCLALGDYDGKGQLRVPRNNIGEVTQGASFLMDNDLLEKLGGDYWVSRDLEVAVARFSTFVDAYSINLDLYNLLYVDVQGMELQVLLGFDDYLKEFQFLNIECTQAPTMKDEAPADVVINYLANMGFQQQTPTLSHNDILFLNVR